MSKQLIEPEKTRIVELETCRRYRAVLDNLPDFFKQDRLDEIVNDLQLIYYSLALAEFGTIVLDKNANLNTDKRGRIENLLKKAEEQQAGSDIGKAFRQETAPGYRVKVRKANSGSRFGRQRNLWEDLGFDLGVIGNCWIEINDIDCKNIKDKITEEDIKALQWLQADIDIGACVYLINEEPNGQRFRPKVQTRLYISRTKSNEKVFFLDTIENGDIHTYSIRGWTNGNRGKELLYCIAAAVETARRYNIKKIALGEREAQEIGVCLGCKEETFFDDTISNLKIGYPEDDDGLNGPYSFALDRSERWRVLNTDDIISINGEEIIRRLDQLEEFLAGYQKIRKNPNKKEEVRLYLQCLGAINEASHPTNYEDNSQRIIHIRSEYGLTCEKHEAVTPLVEAPVTSFSQEKQLIMKYL